MDELLLYVKSPVVSATLALLVLLSIVTWSIAMLKLWRNFSENRRNQAFHAAFWAAQDWPAAAQTAQEGQGDLARLGQAGFSELRSLSDKQQELQHLGSPRDVLERALRQQLQNIQRYHERGLAELATIGSTAPFIGLFGTVWGIMHALQDISRSGSASLDTVAGPIGEALIATAIGIATALPAVLAYNFFLRRLRLKATELENFAHDFMRLALNHDFRL
jgi:biopolymer transport protein ExbB